MSDTVRCALCRFENERRCVRKNSKVKVNKPRHCELYEESREKLDYMRRRMQHRPSPEAVARKEYIWDGVKFKEWDGTKYVSVKDSKTISKLRAEMGGGTPERAERAHSGDSKHPLTGDLSRFFKSTAGGGDEK